MLEAAEPFTVVLTETYDSSWVASANGERISSIPVHGSLTGFSIDKTGSLQITIEYEPQRWFFYGSIISVSTFLARFVCITSDYSRSKDLVKQVKHRFTRNKQQQEMMETTQGNKS